MAAKVRTCMLPADCRALPPPSEPLPKPVLQLPLRRRSKASAQRTWPDGSSPRGGRHRIVLSAAVTPNHGIGSGPARAWLCPRYRSACPIGVLAPGIRWVLSASAQARIHRPCRPRPPSGGRLQATASGCPGGPRIEHRGRSQAAVQTRYSATPINWNTSRHISICTSAIYWILSGTTLHYREPS